MSRVSCSDEYFIKRLISWKKKKKKKKDKKKKKKQRSYPFISYVCTIMNSFVFFFMIHEAARYTRYQSYRQYKGYTVEIKN